MDLLDYEITIGTEDPIPLISGQPLELEPGTYEIKIDALFNNVIVGSAVIAGVVIDAGKTTVISNVLIKPVDVEDGGGEVIKGTINLTVKFDDFSNDTLKFFLDLDDLTETLTGTDTERAFTGDYAPGSYLLRAEMVLKNGREVGDAIAVHVYSGMTTTIVWDLDGDIPTVKVIYDMQTDPQLQQLGSGNGIHTNGLWNSTSGGGTGRIADLESVPRTLITPRTGTGQGLRLVLSEGVNGGLKAIARPGYSYRIEFGGTFSTAASPRFRLETPNVELITGSVVDAGIPFELNYTFTYAQLMSWAQTTMSFGNGTTATPVITYTKVRLIQLAPGVCLTCATDPCECPSECGDCGEDPCVCPPVRVLFDMQENTNIINFDITTLGTSNTALFHRNTVAMIIDAASTPKTMTITGGRTGSGQGLRFNPATFTGLSVFKADQNYRIEYGGRMWVAPGNDDTGFINRARMRVEVPTGTDAAVSAAQTAAGSAFGLPAFSSAVDQEGNFTMYVTATGEQLAAFDLATATISFGDERSATGRIYFIEYTTIKIIQIAPGTCVDCLEDPCVCVIGADGSLDNTHTPGFTAEGTSVFSLVNFITANPGFNFVGGNPLRTSGNASIGIVNGGINVTNRPAGANHHGLDIRIDASGLNINTAANRYKITVFGNVIGGKGETFAGAQMSMGRPENPWSSLNTANVTASGSLFRLTAELPEDYSATQPGIRINTNNDGIGMSYRISRIEIEDLGPRPTGELILTTGWGDGQILFSGWGALGSVGNHHTFNMTAAGGNGRTSYAFPTDDSIDDFTQVTVSYTLTKLTTGAPENPMKLAVKNGEKDNWDAPDLAWPQSNSDGAFTFTRAISDFTSGSITFGYNNDNSADFTFHITQVRFHN